jgi:hypothetical protein
MDFDVSVVGTGRRSPLDAPSSRRKDGAPRGARRARRDLHQYGVHPTKTLVASARAAHVTRRGARLGVRTESVHVDFAR